MFYKKSRYISKLWEKLISSRHYEFDLLFLRITKKNNII